MNNAVMPESNTNLDEMIKSVDEAVEYFNNVPLPHVTTLMKPKKKYVDKRFAIHSPDGTPRKRIADKRNAIHNLEGISRYTKNNPEGTPKKYINKNFDIFPNKKKVDKRNAIHNETHTPRWGKIPKKSGTYLL